MVVKSLSREGTAEQTTTGRTEYWNRIAHEWAHTRRARLWRQHSDQVNGILIRRWLSQDEKSRVLKTDLFDEAVGDGLYPILPQGTSPMVGIDLARTAVAHAQGRYAQLRGLVADVRRLPFKSGSFDAIVSTSTLDHFEKATDLETAFAELNRVLRSGGELVITMDNTYNPILALRRLLQPLLLPIGVLPYFTGVSCNALGLRQLLTRTGFQVLDETTILHSPRVPAMMIARVLDMLSMSPMNRHYLRLLGVFERLAVSKVGQLTGYFVAARAVKS